MKRVCLLAAAVVLALPAAARADKTVDPAAASGCSGNTCKTIGDAVNAAAAGETIRVLKGSYAEDVAVPSGKDGLALAFDPGAAVNGSVSVASAKVKLAGLVLFRTTGTAAALTASGGELALTDATVFATGGDAVAVTKASNVIQRSTILTTAGAAGADGVDMGGGGLQVDSSIVVGGAQGAAFRVTTTQSSGNASVALNHVTSTGASSVVLDGDGNGPIPPVVTTPGNIAFTANASILHGAATASSFKGTLPVPAPNSVSATYTGSDATAMTKESGSPGDPAITVTGAFGPTADAALFKAGTALRLRRDAPVIDKGGPVVAGESGTDIDGEPRTNGGATDIGADEYTNLAPAVTLAVTPEAPASGQIVTATGIASDGNGADDVKGYFVDWGDGHTDTTASNVIQHVYDRSGTYTVSMLVADQSFATSAVVSKTITVSDGLPPQLQVTTPKAGSKVKLTRKRKKGSKRKRRPKALLIKGVDADESGLSSIELAITRVGSKCRQYTGKKLKRAGCTDYTWVKATLKGTGFSLKAKRLGRGTYEIRARGTDTKGNASTTFDAASKTLVTFKVR